MKDVIPLAYAQVPGALCHGVRVHIDIYEEKRGKFYHHVVDRSGYRTRLIRPGEPSPPDDLAGTTPEERLEMVWPLTLEAWEFMGTPIDDSPLQRSVVRVTRGRTGE